METSAAAAQCHYQAGRFSQAITEFEQCDKLWNQHCHKLVPLNNDAGQQQNDDDHQDDEIILADDPIMSPQKRRKRFSPSARVELIALPPLARRADLAMCHFRSAAIASLLSSGVGESSSMTEKTNKQKAASLAESVNLDDDDNASLKEKSTFYFWKEALETNRNYRQALKGAAMSLVHTCNMELQAQRQPQIILQHTRTHKSIRKAMKSTSLALLMAGIAASHLYLHNAENSPKSNAGNNGTKDNAWSVLMEAAVLAADLMRIRREWIHYQMNDNDDAAGSDLEAARSGVTNKSSLLEESLCILNETLCNNRSNRNGRRNNGEFSVDDERGNVAMHSFRSALKVAALATGKLILPKLSTAISKNELHVEKQPSKRQKSKKEDASSWKKDAWNVMYLHSSPLLHCRDRLVDALSFHSAAIRYPQKRELFIDKREVCLDEAVKWENQAGALYYDDDLIETDGCAGYAWKVRTCLHGIKIASASRNNRMEDDDDAQKRTLQSLELLASSSSSQFACDLLGCIHAQRGEFSRAVEKFQLSMEHAGERDSLDADEEIGTGLAERRTVGNMALCFLSMGDVDTPLELFLHLWMTFSESQPSIPKNARPMALLLSSVSDEMECTANTSSIQLDHSTKIQLLWKLFHASSLAQDWGTCLNAMEEMLDGNGCVQQHENHSDMARVFALLQCRRPLAAREIARLLSSKLVSLKNILPAQPLLIAAELYNADALLLSEKSMGVVENMCTPLIYTQRALDALHSASGKKIGKDNKTRNSSSLQELQVILYNDHGLALLIAGDSVGALRCFREAAKHTPSIKTSANTTLPWLLLPTSFNLSLLLLRDGHMEESAKSWLHARGHLSTWHKAVRGDNEALRKLKDLRVMAINRHGLLMAKRSMKSGAMVLDQENIMEWVPPVVELGDVKEDSTRVGGVDASQITALDVVLLRYAVSHAEKKASSSFRKKANSFGY